MNEYKQINSEEVRMKESSRVLIKYPDRIPIIVCKANDCNLPTIDKQKFLVPKDMTVGQFMYIIRKRIRLKPEKALFLLINNNLLTGGKLIKEVYEYNKDTDGFLYITYCSENTFG